MNAQEFILHFKTAANYLESLKDDVNKLNVFPVPDGDTGTNMALTLNSVVKELESLSPSVGLVEIRKAITMGSLMGARGNSGVITSQILRGFCEGLENAVRFDSKTLANALEKSKEVAYAAVRKPVEGTILTVIADVSIAASRAADAGLDTQATLRAIVDEAFVSVQRTPDLLPVLKENGVVDAGGYGLAVLIQGFVASALGEKIGEARISGFSSDEPESVEAKVAIEQINDWEGSTYLYCTEFLFNSNDLDIEEALDFLASMGDCELLVGSHPNFKIHVHTNDPGSVLTYMTSRGQALEVHISNMHLQIAERDASLRSANADVSASFADGSQTLGDAGPDQKKRGYIAVASGRGMHLILESLGVDIIVNGGQTMNPSTAELLQAIESVNSEEVIVFPNNKNIIMAAQAAADVSDKTVAIVPTRSVPESFTALFVANSEHSLDEEVEEMIEAAAEVHAAEITHAIKEATSAHGEEIKAGDVIGVSDSMIEAVGSDVGSVAIKMVEYISDDNHDTLTILAGEQLNQEDFEELVAQIEDAYPDLEIDARRGDQPLYPLIMAAE
ncbi:MAG: DAK2 domain-containing protein [Coriobacteriia bacterium]|nr:DAK2 domain-containing protein [Coriobacteriia bacterium]